jgi:hypothetical protein
MMMYLLITFAYLLAISTSANTGSTTSNHNPEIPAFLYSTVTSFKINTNVNVDPTKHSDKRNLKDMKEEQHHPYGSHIKLSFGTEGRLTRNYTDLLLELNKELLGPDYVVTLDGEPIASSGVNTAYKAELPNDSGWVRVTLVPNHPELFHAFIFHADEEDLVIVEPLQTSELSRTMTKNDPNNPTHERLRRTLSDQKNRVENEQTIFISKTMVAYSHSRDVHPSIKTDNDSSWHKTRRVLKNMSKRRNLRIQKRRRLHLQKTNEDHLNSMNSFTNNGRELGNAMGVPLQEQVTTYQGPYGTASGCPATVQKIRMGLAADAGFYTGVSGTSASSGANLVAAYINNMINVANVIYVDQFNVFLSIGEYLMYSSSSASPTFSGGNWNQIPLDSSQAAGSARGDHGCYISRYEKANTNQNDRICCGYTYSDGSGADTDYGRLLTRFKDWTNNEMSSMTNGRGDTYGLWHLFTNCFPPAGTVGLASLRATCRTYNSGWSTLTSGTWETFTHEIGHNFGAPHTMNTGGIMSYDTSPEFKFTGTNENDVCTHIADSRSQDGTHPQVRMSGSQCFTNFATGTCGNFILEQGEDCDGGSCCTSSCTLKSTAHCNYQSYYISSDGSTINSLTNECCTSTCKPSGTQLCDNGNGFCRNGKCDGTASGIGGAYTNSNTQNWCYYSNFQMCDNSNVNDLCKIRCNPVDTNLGCKAIADLTNNYASGIFDSWRKTFKNGDVCDTSNGQYKVCSDGTCIDAVDPKAGGIEPPEPETITASTPLVSWTAGNSASVSWSTSSGISSSESLSIILKKNGATVATLISSTLNDGSQTIVLSSSLIPGSDYKVCVLQVSTPSIIGCSSNFVVLAAPNIESVTLTPLAAGNSAVIGSTYNILWTTTGAVANVKIQLYHNGALERTIITTTTNDYTHQWLVPSTGLPTGSGYIVRVRNTADDSNYADSSSFNVDPVSRYTVVTPSSGDVWIKGQADSITWTSAGSSAFTSNNVRLDLGKNGNLIGYFTESTANDGTYAVSGSLINSLDVGNDFYVKISDSATGTVEYITQTFSVQDPPPDPAITTTAPNDCTAGTSCTVTWTIVGSVGATVQISYVFGSSTTTIATNVVTSDKSYSWNIPSNQATGTYYIKVQDSFTSSVNDLSDAMIILVAPSLTLTDIIPSSTWTRGATAEIRWSSSGAVGNSIQIKINRNGATVSTLTAGTNNDGSYTVADSVTLGLIANSGYTVVITSASSGGLTSTSSSFSVVDPDSITVNNPISGCVVGGTCSIGWSKTGSVSTVKISYSGSGVSGTVVSSTTTNPYTWNVPINGVPPGSTYTVRVEMTSKSSVFSTSNSFTIAAQPAIAIVAPSSSTQWITGQTASILWTAQGSAASGTVTITLKHSSASDAVLTSTTSASSGSYTVTTAQTTAIVARSGYTVHIVAGGISATSSSFSVHLPPNVEINDSNPSKCIIGSSCSIVFTTVGLVSNVKMTYYKGGTNGIVVSSTNTSPYSWLVPGSLTEGNWNIRIEDVNDPNLADVSLASCCFSIIIFSIIIHCSNN